MGRACRVRILFDLIIFRICFSLARVGHRGCWTHRSRSAHDRQPLSLCVAATGPWLPSLKKRQGVPEEEQNRRATDRRCRVLALESYGGYGTTAAAPNPLTLTCYSRDFAVAGLLSFHHVGKLIVAHLCDLFDEATDCLEKLGENSTLTELLQVRFCRFPFDA